MSLVAAIYAQAKIDRAEIPYVPWDEPDEDENDEIDALTPRVLASELLQKTIAEAVPQLDELGFEIYSTWCRHNKISINCPSMVDNGVQLDIDIKGSAVSVVIIYYCTIQTLEWLLRPDCYYTRLLQAAKERHAQFIATLLPQPIAEEIAPHILPLKRHK